MRSRTMRRPAGRAASDGQTLLIDGGILIAALVSWIPFPAVAWSCAGILHRSLIATDQMI